MFKKNEPEQKATDLEKSYGELEELFYGWELFSKRGLFDELAKRCRAFLAAYDKWVKQFES